MKIYDILFTVTNKNLTPGEILKMLNIEQSPESENLIRRCLIKYERGISLSEQEEEELSFLLGLD